MLVQLKHIGITLLLFITVVTSFAQEVEFTAQTSANEVKTGDRFQIQILLFQILKHPIYQISEYYQDLINLPVCRW